MTRTEIIAAANEYRELPQDATRQQLIDWLVWNDSNGIYSDEDCIDNGFPVLTFDAALQAVADCVAGV